MAYLYIGHNSAWPFKNGWACRCVQIAESRHWSEGSAEVQSASTGDVQCCQSRGILDASREKTMSWFIWALLSAFFAGLTAILAKIGVAGVNSNLATAIRTVVIVVFAWAVALATDNQTLSSIGKKTWLFLVLSGLATCLSWLCYFRALQIGEASQV